MRELTCNEVNEAIAGLRRETSVFRALGESGITNARDYCDDWIAAGSLLEELLFAADAVVEALWRKDHVIYRISWRKPFAGMVEAAVLPEAIARFYLAAMQEVS